MSPEAIIAEQRIPPLHARLLSSWILSLISFEIRSRLSTLSALRCWSAPTMRCETQPRPENSTVLDLVNTGDLACAFYFKPVACLQRSAVLCRQLRRRGIVAQVIIGIHRFPFRSHAWVEVDGVPVNERRRAREIYVELDRWG